MKKKFYFPSSINLKRLINKLQHKPDQFKDHLYDNLNLIDKINMIFNQKYGLLDHIFPKLNKVLDVTNKSLMILANIFWFVFTLIIGCFNVSIGVLVLSLIIAMTSLAFSMIYFFERDFRYNNKKSALEKISFIFVSILSFSWLIDFFIVLIVLFIFNGQSKVRKFVYENIERKFCNEFNEIYRDDQNVAYLRHEMLNEVSFNIEDNFINYNYFYEYGNLFIICQCCDLSQNERALVKYIKYHTNRELNFKQLLLKLVYLEQKHTVDQQEELFKRAQKDEEIIQSLIDNQKSEKDLLKRQFCK